MSPFPLLHEDDIDRYMRLAIDAAQKTPVHNGNPQVGCALVIPYYKDNPEEVLRSFRKRTKADETDSEGFTSSFVDSLFLGDPVPALVFIGVHRGDGTPHAEVDVLNQALKTIGLSFDFHMTDATAIVTLEPCSHQGKNPPCTDLLIDADVGEVIYAVDDPNPIASGGAQVLRDAGINVYRADEICSHETIRKAKKLIDTWRTSLEQQRPWTIAKIAQTADGYVAAEDGTSQWITGSLARNAGHQVRSEVDAIIVGTGTVLADDPQLSARPGGKESKWQPRKVVVGMRRIPATAKLMQTKDQPLIYRTYDIRSVLEDLYSKGMRKVLIEGGPTLVSAALREGVVNQLDVYISSKIFGAGKKSVTKLGVHTLADAIEPDNVKVRQLGKDVLMSMRFDHMRPSRNDEASSEGTDASQGERSEQEETCSQD